MRFLSILPSVTGVFSPASKGDAFVVLVQNLDCEGLGPDVGGGSHDDRRGTFVFKLRKLLTLLVVYVTRDLFGDANGNQGGAFFLDGQRQDAHNFERHAFERLDRAAAATARALAVSGATHAGTHALTRHFDEPERTGAKDSRLRAIALHGVAQGSFDGATMLFARHVDEVVDDYAAEIAESNLARDFFRRAQV